VGSGFGQVLPILLACHAKRDSTFLIKQPELHIHPALQGDIADELIKSALECDNKLLIETHSEHLLLRVLRRIREGKLDPDKVSVVYVENTADGSLIREMPITPEGQLLRDWPGGFFEEGLREVLM
jgi:predicted ATPase